MDRFPIRVRRKQMSLYLRLCLEPCVDSRAECARPRRRSGKIDLDAHPALWGWANTELMGEAVWGSCSQAVVPAARPSVLQA